MWVNMSIIGMIVVDVWLLYSQCMNAQDEKQKEFNTLLVEKLIDSSFKEVRRVG